MEWSKSELVEQQTLDETIERHIRKALDKGCKIERERINSILDFCLEITLKENATVSSQVILSIKKAINGKN